MKNFYIVTKTELYRLRRDILKQHFEAKEIRKANHQVGTVKIYFKIDEGDSLSNLKVYAKRNGITLKEKQSKK